jgi:hypothetical protein
LVQLSNFRSPFDDAKIREKHPSSPFATLGIRPGRLGVQNAAESLAPSEASDLLTRPHAFRATSTYPIVSICEANAHPPYPIKLHKVLLWPPEVSHIDKQQSLGQAINRTIGQCKVQSGDLPRKADRAPKAHPIGLRGSDNGIGNDDTGNKHGRRLWPTSF